MATTRGVTPLQKLDLLPAILQSLCETVASAIWWPYQRAKAPRTLKRHILLTLMRKVFKRLSVEQVQYISGTTQSAYTAWTQSQHLPQKSITLPYANTKAFWIGSPHADTVILYFHGGGWAMPGSAAHFKLLADTVSHAASGGKSVAALAVQYTLAPAGVYPHQLTQCVELLRYALHDLNKSPRQIILGGDSAGGNMVLGVLSHLLHAHPAIAAVEMVGPLKAAFVSSPVVAFDFSRQRFRSNEVYEPAPNSTLTAWVANYLGRSPKDGWNEPARNGAEWWEGLETKVERLLVTDAADEVMAEDIQAVAATIKTVFPELTLFTSKNDFHAEPGIGPLVGLEESEAARVIKSWVAEQL